MRMSTICAVNRSGLTRALHAAVRLARATGQLSGSRPRAPPPGDPQIGRYGGTKFQRGAYNPGRSWGQLCASLTVSNPDIEKSLAAHGEARVHYRTGGVTCDIRLPLPESPQPHEGGPMTLSQALASAPLAAPAASRADDIRGTRILLVEDEPLIAMDVIATLSDAGCDVVGPATTLATARARIAAADFDVALLDANLGGEPVNDLAAALTRLNIPFAFLTGYGRAGLPETFREAPMIAKPFTREHAFAVVGQLVRQGESAVPRRQSST